MAFIGDGSPRHSNCRRSRHSSYKRWVTQTQQLQEMGHSCLFLLIMYFYVRCSERENQPTLFWKFPSCPYPPGLHSGSNEILMSHVQDESVSLDVNLKEPLGLKKGILYVTLQVRGGLGCVIQRSSQKQAQEMNRVLIKVVICAEATYMRQVCVLSTEQEAESLIRCRQSRCLRDPF